MFDFGMNLTPLEQEIREFQRRGWPKIKTPHMQILRYFVRFAEEAQQRDPQVERTTILRRFAKLLDVSAAWIINYETLSKVPQEILRRITTAEEELKIRFMSAVEFAKRGDREELLAQAEAFSQGNENQFRILLERTLSEGKQRKHFSRQLLRVPRKEGPIVVGKSPLVPASEPTPAPTPVPTSSQAPIPLQTTPDEDTSSLEITRAYFAMSMKSVRPPPRRIDLPPINQPKVWDPDKVVQVEKGHKEID